MFSELPGEIEHFVLLNIAVWWYLACSTLGAIRGIWLFPQECQSRLFWGLLRLQGLNPLILHAGVVLNQDCWWLKQPMINHHCRAKSSLKLLTVKKRKSTFFMWRMVWQGQSGKINGRCYKNKNKMKEMLPQNSLNDPLMFKLMMSKEIWPININNAKWCDLRN